MEKKKRVKKFINNRVKIIIAFILGALISGGTVYAAYLYEADEVSYSNTTSGATTTNVQDALDELYTKSNTWINPNNIFGTPEYYAFGTYKGWCSSTDTNCNSYSDFPTTSTEEDPPTGKNVYAGKYSDGGYGICINRNGTEHCFRGRNWIAEAQHVQKVFSGANDRCRFYSSNVDCDGDDFNCVVNSSGRVSCGDYGTGAFCYVDFNGSVQCFE